MLPVRKLGRQRLDARISQIVGCAEQRGARRSRSIRLRSAHLMCPMEIVS